MGAHPAAGGRRHHRAADDALHGRGGGAGRPGGRALRPGDRGAGTPVVHRRARPGRGDHPLPPARGHRRPATLPVPAQPADDGHVEIHTEDEMRVLHELTGWALEGGYPLAGLSVLRVSLEDIYLGLTDGGGVGACRATRRAGGQAMSTSRRARPPPAPPPGRQTPIQGSFRGLSDLPLVARQVYYEQLSFWLNPIGGAADHRLLGGLHRHLRVDVGPLDDRLPGAHQPRPVLPAGLRHLRRDGGLLQHPGHSAGEPPRDGPAQAPAPQPAPHLDAAGRHLRQLHDRGRRSRSCWCSWWAASATTCTGPADSARSCSCWWSACCASPRWASASARWCPTPTPPGRSSVWSSSFWWRCRASTSRSSPNSRAGHLHRLLPDPPPHHGLGGLLQRHPGHVGVERPARARALGRRRRVRQPAPLGVVAQAQLNASGPST